MRGICTKKIGAISQLGAEKITFPPTDRHTHGRTDLDIYGVASLLKIEVVGCVVLRKVFSLYEILCILAFFSNFYISIGVSKGKYFMSFFEMF